MFAQLPVELKEVWAEGEQAEREPITMNRQEFYERVVQDAGLPSTREARWMTLAVFAARKEQISPLARCCPTGRRRHRPCRVG